ncbi:DUF2798 domain-containing protein [Vibrio sp. SCSIO 43140]|uniref:DUF2798 domain-containing protein n=1 Tax=Vibrio sp. SCSIO 43140 TaxID=2819100 RepID=UPI002075B93F|nr:DUF2798 domain-containing protein [Vibrio sp. SCSIO 43140]USD63027.1 DUF2798 domain-containing protein [Vibrio sp. SCSIO 43140]
MSRKQFWLTALLSSLAMALMMSGIISGYKMGFSADWPETWVKSFLIAWPCALLLNLTVLPKIRAFAAWCCQPKTIKG